MMVQGLIQIEAAKTVSHFATTPHDGCGLRKNSIKFLRGDSFIVRASCSADPDKRVHSISVMDPGFPVCVCVCVGGGGGGTNDPCPRPAPAGVWGTGCKLLHRV